jgi:3-dehydroquinate synthase
MTPAREIKYYDFDEVIAVDILKGARGAVDAAAEILATDDSPDEKLRDILSDSNVQAILVTVSRLPVFSKEMGRAFKNDLDLLRILKQLKYFWDLATTHFAILLEQVSIHTCGEEKAAAFTCFQAALAATQRHGQKIKDIAHTLPSNVQAEYRKNADYLEVADPHAVYPTSIYRQCDALTLATQDASTIEAIMSTSLTTTIKITRDVLSSANRLLYDVYKPLGRCVAVIDDKVEALYGSALDKYFASHRIEYVKLVYSGNEADKDIRDVENILVDMKKNGVARNEPLLVVGGGVISDIAGFAAALYSRNTPYVMLCTSIVSGIDAGPSPRTCCNGFDYKNLYGAYHPPVLTLTDRGMWRTLHRGWLRHGIAEIIKMAVVEDRSLFELLERWGSTLVRTKFGTERDSLSDKVFQDDCDLIVGKAMEGYVRSEYGNLWETHQCRPHAYGHTWSPGYELLSGMLHGHAVATCMGFGAYLACKEGFIPEEEMTRIHNLISDCELTLYHPIMDDSEKVWKAHLAMVEKRGGNLCAPVPKPLGRCGYINDLSREQLNVRLVEYKVLCAAYPRGGMGVEAHCVEVGLEDPQSKKENPMKAEEGRFIATPTDRAVVSLAKVCACCRSDKKARANIMDAQRIIEGLSAMPAKYSSQPSADLRRISLETAKTNPMWKTMAERAGTSRLMEAEMMSGQLEGQLLQFLVRFGRVTTALDIGTFTGYSALALAEALPDGGQVVTLERDADVARHAASSWACSPHAAKIVSLVGEASVLLSDLAAQKEAFDLIFLDADKPGYLPLYRLLMESGLLRVGGLLVADNTMYKGEELLGELCENGKGARAFNEALLADDRVSQVMLPLRDGLSLVHRLR